jgi:DNA repair exonuclease SbcCD nuclease subunit
MAIREQASQYASRPDHAALAFDAGHRDRFNPAAFPCKEEAGGTMAFTFLHAADLHLGSPFQGLAQKDAEVARRFAEASRAAFSDLVSAAIEEGVAFVVISGDIYDGRWKDMAVGFFFNREVSRLTRAGIPVFMVRGNHDAESDVAQALPLPDGVTLFSARHAETHRLETLRVALHGRSFRDREVTENFAVTYPAAVDGWFNIGLLHTSLEGNADHVTYAPCSIADLRSRGYDYWALGHVHEFQVLNEHPHVVYPGNLQGRSIRERGAKGAVLVDVEDGRVTGLRRLIRDRARWSLVEIDLTGIADAADLRATIRGALEAELGQHADRPVALRVVLSGETPLHRALVAGRADWHTEIQSFAHHVMDDVWLEALKLATRHPEAAVAASPDLDGLDVATLLADLAEDAALRAEAEALMKAIRDKVPPMIDLPADLDALLNDARDLALGRALGAGKA